MQHQEYTFERVSEARGLPVYASDGDKIGEVEEVYLAEDSNQPEWLGIGTGFLGMKRVLVPVETAEFTADAVRVPYEKDHVKDAPDFDDDVLLRGEAHELYSYYGVRGSQRVPAADRYLERDQESRGEGEITRSEEELQVGKRDVERGRLRVHKWVETEQQEVPVEVRKEKARVYRESVNEPVGEREIGDDSVEVTLREEQPVVQKQTVAKERIGIDKDVETEQRTVSEEVRKERVDIDDETK
jgi:uncharacterized protein (TIGR02271 family)